MATTGMYKLDDGNSFPTNCFPARSLLRPRYQEGAGHWQVARQAAEETKIELLLGAKSSQIRWKAEGVLSATLRHLDEKTLDSAQLIKLHHVKIPSDLCSVNISNQNFVSAKEEDFEMFTSVAYINATENLLTLDVFRKFPELRELELSLNGLRNLKINAGDFPHLEILDLSYNNLSPEDVQALGVLSHLKVLHLTANGLNSLPLDLAVSESEDCPKFPALEVLLLDDNHLSHPDVFVSLANLRSLKQLNLDRNGIKEVPYLHHSNHSRFSIHPLSAKSGIKEGVRSRKTARKRLRQDKHEYIILHSTKDPDRTEVVFPSWSPEPTMQEDSLPPAHLSESSANGATSEFTLPLPELRFLSLADNQIEHEEDLLAVALFPSLTELTFYGNPFTTSRSGDPPLLTSFLQNKLGIKMVRKKISKLEKPRIFIPVKANRKVTSQLPKVRKHPRMIEALPETTFWQLWTGDELLASSRSFLRDRSRPLPSILSCSSAYDSTMKILSPLHKGEISAPYSRASSLSEESLVSCVSSFFFETPLESKSSLDQILFEDAREVRSSEEPILLESLPRGGTFLKPQGRRDSTPPTEPSTTEHLPPETLPPARNEPASAPPSRRPSDGTDLAERTSSTSGSPLAERDRSGLLPPPNSPSQERTERISAPGTPTEHQELPETPLASVHGQPQGTVPSLTSALPERASPEPDLPAGSPSGEGRTDGSSRPASPLSETEELPKGFPSPESPGADQDPLEATAPTSPTSQGLDVSEWPLLTGSLAEEDALGAASSHVSLAGWGPDEPAPLGSSGSKAQDLSEPISSTEPPKEELDSSEPLPPIQLHPAEDDQLESLPFPIPSVEERDLSEAGRRPSEPDSVESPSLSVEPHLSSQTSVTGRSFPEDQQGLEPLPPASSESQGPSQTDTEPQTGWPAELEESSKRRLPTSSFPIDPATPLGDLPPPESPTASKTSLQLLSPSSRELYQLFARIHSEAAPSGLYDELSAESEMLSSSQEFVGAEKSVSFFMTQVDATSGSHLEPTERSSMEELTAPSRVVPEKYRGYEEILGGDPGPDFIEPVGIQHNVQALEKALRYPRVYRDGTARLDSFQKPYVPYPKKVSRVPPKEPQKDKVERLEEILLRMRNPTNIVHIPLVCVLRKKKENWREYRQALALLKEFREEYRGTVASCESKKLGKKLDQGTPSQVLGPIPQITVSAPEVEESPEEEEELLITDLEGSPSLED